MSNTYHEIFDSKPCVTLTYSESSSILTTLLKSKHIQNPVKYLRRSILLRTLSSNSKFSYPIYLGLSLIKNRSTSFTPWCINYSLQLLTYYYSCFQYTLLKYDLLLSYSFFQSLFCICARELLITHPIINIW